MISIHALRGEGDGFYFKKWEATKIFQSTPSVGRATPTPKRSSASTLNFNPRPPWGGRPPESAAHEDDKKISIHALRGEGDILTPLSLPRDL